MSKTMSKSEGKIKRQPLCRSMFLSRRELPGGTLGLETLVQANPLSRS